MTTDPDRRPIGGADPAVAAVRRIAARMRATPAATYPLEALAAEAGVGRTRLIRLFRATIGMTPHAYLVARRIACAKAGLRAGLPPASVAVDCGFTDQAHLTAAFRRLTGATPASFAREAQAADDPDRPDLARRAR